MAGGAHPESGQPKDPARGVPVKGARGKPEQRGRHSAPGRSKQGGLGPPAGVMSKVVGCQAGRLAAPAGELRVKLGEEKAEQTP